METVKLGEIEGFSQGLQASTGDQETTCPSEDYVRFIRIVDHTEDTQVIRYIKNPGAKYVVNEDDIVMIRYGSASMGLVGRGKRGVIANHIFKISPDEKRVHKPYLFYCLQSDAIQRVIWLANASSTMPALTCTIAGDLDIPLPALRSQRRIADLLFACDELMKNRQRRIRILEAMARTLYRECIRGDGGETSDRSIQEAPFWKRWNSLTASGRKINSMEFQSEVLAQDGHGLAQAQALGFVEIAGQRHRAGAQLHGRGSLGPADLQGMGGANLALALFTPAFLGD